jgi:large subunit ribosomal protein L1
MKISKRHSNNRSKVDKTKLYPVNEAIALLKGLEGAKFDETVEMHVNLGVDPRHADQNIRGTVSYPNGTGKEVKVLVLTNSKVDEAKEAGADFVGLDEYVEKIEQGWSEMDIVVCTPDAMGKVGKLGRILGPKGIMPSPKSGTLTMEVGKAVKEIKAGRVEYRVDKNGIVHVPVGKKSFDENSLQENIKTLFTELEKKRPNSVKGAYVRRVCLSSTMGPGIKVDDRSIA